MCKHNNLKIGEERDTVDNLRKKLREYVKEQNKKGDTANVKTWVDINEQENKSKKSIKTMEFSANLDFELYKHDWEKFIDRIEQYFIANDIDEQNKKRAILLSKVNADTYDIVDKV